MPTMEKSRMPHGDYKKMLIRIPQDVVTYLEARSIEDVRSINAEIVYLLRQVMAHDHAGAQTIRQGLLESGGRP